ncbi:MAG: helix-turn-helix domain-containing protein [Bacteriovoracaceae bacterium]|nr:helix-turn-helix domain-containing protein [Bacteriovoracaceae bacterium]
MKIREKIKSLEMQNRSFRDWVKVQRKLDSSYVKQFDPGHCTPKPVELLKDEFYKITDQDPDYSLRSFAKQLGLTCGRLSEYFNGKRKLTQEVVLKLSEKLQFTEQQTSDFVNLVKLEDRVHGDDKKEFKGVLEHILNLPETKKRERKREGTGARTFRHTNKEVNWCHLAILCILSDKTRDIAFVSKVLGADLLVIDKAIEFLRDQKYILVDDKNAITSIYKNKGAELLLKNCDQKTVVAISHGLFKKLTSNFTLIDHTKPYSMISNKSMAMSSGKMPIFTALIDYYMDKMCDLLYVDEGDKYWIISMNLLPVNPQRCSTGEALAMKNQKTKEEIDETHYLNFLEDENLLLKELIVRSSKDSNKPDVESAVSNKQSNELLRNEYAAIKKKNAMFSVRAFAKKLGISNGHFNNIFQDTKSINMEIAEKINSNHDFSTISNDTFLEIVRLEEFIKNELSAEFKLFAKALNRDQKIVSDNAAEKIDHWAQFVLTSASLLRDYTPELDWLCEKLGLTPKEAKKNIGILTELGMFQQTAQKSVNKKRNWKALPLNHVEVAKSIMDKTTDTLSKIQQLDEHGHHFFKFIPTSAQKVQEHYKTLYRYHRLIAGYLTEDEGPEEMYFFNCELLPLNMENI